MTNKKEGRKPEGWMILDQEGINDLSDEDWEHYKSGGCLCFSHSIGECLCGSGWRDDEEEINF